MKKSFLFLVALSCALFLFTGCPDPNSNPEAPAENPNGTVTVHDIVIDIPTVSLEELPASVGEDSFAGKTYENVNVNVNGFVDRYVFNDDGTVSTHYDYIYDYSYDSNFLYMRIKYLDLEDPGTGDVIKERVTPQEYINYIAVYLAQNFDKIVGSKKALLPLYNENKASCDEASGGDSYEDYIVYTFNIYLGIDELGCLLKYTYNENSFTEIIDGSEQNVTYTLVED